MPTALPRAGPSSVPPLRVTSTSRGILARGKGAEHEPVGQHRGHVLQAVHGDVDAAVEQRLLDLLHEERLAAEVGEGDVGEAVAGRPDGHDLDVDAEGAQRPGDQFDWTRASRLPRVPMRIFTPLAPGGRPCP